MTTRGVVENYPTTHLNYRSDQAADVFCIKRKGWACFECAVKEIYVLTEVGIVLIKSKTKTRKN